MKRISLKGALLITISVISLMAFAIQEKVIRVMKGEEILHELKASEFDYIEVGDFVQAPTGMNVDIANNAITIKWDKVDGASYNIYRSGDNVNFPLLASDLKDNIYVDDSPLTGTNYYKVKAIVNGSESSYTTTVGATFDSSENLESGIYLGINGFNETIYNYPIEYLDNSSYQNSLNFIDNLSINNGTLLYYSVDEALTALTSTQYPSDIKTVALVTFTDGLDQGSLMKMRGKYKDEMEYLEALNNRISNGTVHGVPITAYTIGLYGSNDPLKEWFTLNMQKLASSTENAFLVTNMAEVNAKFEEIAQQLNQRTDIQTVKIRMPGLADGRKVRFTFDNISNTYGKTQADMMRSKKYIEGSFNMDNYTLENVSYNGLTCESGSNIFGTVDGIYVEFTFKGIITDDRTILKKEYTDEWHYLPYVGASGWQYNSEFEKARDVEILVEKTSAAIMLNLDCSESLGNDFETIKKDAKDFINIIHNATSELPENPNPVTSVTLDVKNATDIKGNDIAEVPAEGTSYGTARHIELESFVIDGFTFTVTQSESDKTAKASYYYPMSTNPEGGCTVRMYSGSQLTITAPAGTKMAQIEFTGSVGKADASKYSCEPGQLSGITANAQTWTYASGTESVTISYEAQFRISTMTVTLEGSGVEDPRLPLYDNLYIIGDLCNQSKAKYPQGQTAVSPDEGWALGNGVRMNKLAQGIFEINVEVLADSWFAFNPVLGDPADGWEVWNSTRLTPSNGIQKAAEGSNPMMIAGSPDSWMLPSGKYSFTVNCYTGTLEIEGKVVREIGTLYLRGDMNGWLNNANESEKSRWAFTTNDNVNYTLSGVNLPATDTQGETKVGIWKIANADWTTQFIATNENGNSYALELDNLYYFVDMDPGFNNGMKRAVENATITLNLNSKTIKITK